MKTNRILIAAAFLAASATAALAGPQIGDKFRIPVDQQAVYTIQSIEKQKDGSLSVISSRVGPSGTDFSARDINCAAKTWRYTAANAESADAAKAKIKRADKMTKVQSGSIVDYLAGTACKLATPTTLIK